jgi:large subunit ribosomal protein L32
MRRDRRRANWKATPPTVGTCPRCKEPIQPHRACKSCGYYRSHEVIQGTAD